MPRRAASSVHAALGPQHEAIALLGAIGGGSAYLVRERTQGDLFVARLLKRRQGDTAGRPIVAMLRELDSSIPAPGVACPSCGTEIGSWAQKCTKCGARLAAPPAVSDLVSAANGRYQLLGTLPVYGGGAVAFARRAEDGAVVALHAREWHDAETGDHLVLVEAGPLAPPPEDVEAESAATGSESLAAGGGSAAAREGETGEGAPPTEGAEESAAAELPIAEMPTHVMEAVGEGQGQLREPTRWVRKSNLSSGPLARQSTPIESVAVPKVCPMCGTEYETEARFCPKDGSSLRPKGGSDPLVGQIIADRYHVLKRIGEGGMGRVYLAEHVRMGRMCAIKVMRSALLNDDEAMARFAREASNAARILHPNVAAVFDYGESDGIVYLVMEYVEGEPLSTIIARDHALPVARVLDLTKQVTDALIAAHEMGVVHRDLKPDNILVTKRGEREVAKVVDFGIAKAVAESPHEALTRSGLVIGTPEFMSPEQLLGDPVDERTDLYSLGCIVFLMLTGSQAAEAPTREAMLKRRLHELPPHPRAVNRALPPDLDAIVVRLLAGSASERFASAAELRESLERVRLGGSVSTPTAMPAVPALGKRTTPLRFDTPIRRAAQPASRARRRMALASVGVLTGVAAVVAALVATDVVDLRGGSEPVAPPAAASSDSLLVIRPPTSDSSGLLVRPGPLTPSAPNLGLPGTIAPPRPTAPPVRIDTAPARPEPRVSPAEAGIVATVNAYASAVTSGELARIRQVYPGMSREQERAQQRLFSQYRVVTARVQNVQVELSGETARATFTLVQRIRDRTSLDETSSRRAYRATLVRRDGVWMISDLN